jgi:hypothetical protein
MRTPSTGPHAYGNKYPNDNGDVYKFYYDTDGTHTEKPSVGLLGGYHGVFIVVKKIYK